MRKVKKIKQLKANLEAKYNASFIDGEVTINKESLPLVLCSFLSCSEILALTIIHKPILR